MTMMGAGGRGGCCSIRRVEGWWVHGKDRGGELERVQGAESEGLQRSISEERTDTRDGRGRIEVPSSIPRPERSIGTRATGGWIASVAYWAPNGVSAWPRIGIVGQRVAP